MGNGSRRGIPPNLVDEPSPLEVAECRNEYLWIADLVLNNYILEKEED
jgi:hypothetical protein